MVAVTAPSTQRWQWLPAPNSWKYHALLAAIGLCLLGPLGGLAASYMNFSIGFYVGGQVLAGILGSTITFGYGADGKHGANYMQTIAASVAQMSAMAVVLQAMDWLGLPQPPMWKIVLYLTCIGMFGVGVGMLFTPILVDRMQLTFPSGLAVANILRALTDPVLLRRSVSTLGSGMAIGLAGGIGSAKVAWLGAINLSTSTFGAGMIVGARIGIPTIVAGLTGLALHPYFVSIGWLHQDDPFRKITFLIGLGLILGASLVDITLILWEAARRLRSSMMGLSEQAAAEIEPWKKTSTRRLVLWVLAWGVGILFTGTSLMNVPVAYMAFALALVCVFVVVIGISTGMTDSTPISAAFVVTVVLLASLGLRDPGIGMIAATVLLVSCGVATDMQQDRSTGWRLGTNRTTQFRYQVGGILVGAIMAVVYARLFMGAYPVLTLDQTAMTADQQPGAWASAMTYKFVGALRSLTDDKPYQRTAIWVGVGLGAVVQIARTISCGTMLRCAGRFLSANTVCLGAAIWFGVGFGAVVQIARLVMKASRSYRRFAASGRAGYAIEFMLDAVVLPSPYAYSFGFFFNLPTSEWFGAGSMLSSLYNTLSAKYSRNSGKQQALPSDMSPTSLVGGGLIAGDAIAALSLGLLGLVATLVGGAPK
jgi:uncharacterized oligopeptide transporter (OPT) family protein